MAFSIKKQANLNLKKNTTFKIPRTPPISFLGLALWLKADAGVTLGISQIIISGFTGIYAGANGTYNYNYEENSWYKTGSSYYISSGGELRDDNDQTLIATNNNNFQGAWSPSNYFSTITLSNAGIPSVNVNRCSSRISTAPNLVDVTCTKPPQVSCWTGWTRWLQSARI